MRFGRYIASYLLVGAFTLLCLVSSVSAASTPWVQAPEAQIRLISESSTVGTEDTIRLGMEFKLTPHWKIYWRSPGEAGLPPIPDYEGSKNLKSADFHWPLPDRFAYLGIETYGYQDSVVFPIDVVLNEAGKATEIQAKVDYLICAELCIPGNANLNMKLDAGALTQDAETNLISQAMAKVPASKSDALAVEDFTLDMEQENPVLVVSTSSTAGFDKPQLIVEGPEGYFFNPAEMTASEDMKFATFTVAAELLYQPDVPMTRDTIRITLVDGEDAVDVSAADMVNSGQPINSNFAAKTKAPLSFSLLVSMLLAAVLGGLILNLMPCVLPVLSIKLMSVIDKSGKSNRDVRLGFLATTAGIIVSFLVLALALIGLKAAGASIGWGVQFQQPIFVLILMAIILLFAANMFGWFEITLPARLSNLGSGPENKGLASDFATGAFATLLATPCSAPFLGTAVSFALAQNAITILLIFAALGVGMTLPYILVILFPRLVSYLPKPGMWMVKLRMVLGGLLIITAIWLMTILLAQLGWTAVIIALVISSLMMGMLWIMRTKRSLLPVVALAVSAILVVLPPLFKSDINAKELDKPWVVFDQKAITKHIGDGKVVYVDVTADWCVTCKVNKAVIFASDEVNKVFASKDTVAMLADWTRPSDEINAYLQSFNRAGIPFNAIYSAKYPQGKALSEILTPSLVLEELANAR